MKIPNFKVQKISKQRSPHLTDLTQLTHLTSSSERGVALVITLILLSVITFMAVTFLVVTQAEKKSVVTKFDQDTAAQMSDSAVEFAKMQILAPMLASNNTHTLSFLVSTNYFNPGGFVSGDPSWLNVNYDYKNNGSTFTLDDVQQNESNLRYLPRPPVFVTNSVYGSNEFRYYIDLNRNGRFDPTGMLTVTNANGQPVLDAANNPVTSFFQGDPQWIGIGERPGFPHSSSNRYVGRYAFVVVPASETLDINNIHNYAKALGFNMNGDGFLRDMGVGSYELNLGAFFTDLNTNYWPPANGKTTWGQQYRYDPFNVTVANQGAGFEDAVGLLRSRYAGRWNTGIWSVRQLFGPNGVAAFGSDDIDGYASGPVMTGFHWPIAGQDRDLPARVNGGWAGSENTNRFFDLQDFFDRTKVGAATPISIVERLKAANASFDSYDRYTFYRLLAQLGTDSPPDSGKMNLNYVNIDTNGVVVPDMATNFIAWTNAVHFFTNAAIRLLKDSFAQPLTNILSTNFSAYLTNGLFSSNAPPGFNATVITNYLANLLDDKGHLKIQIYPTNFYTPSVHRLLQLAANMYDASSTNFFPSVFRPVFFDAAAPGGPAIARSNFVFIVDYQEVKDANLLVNNTTFSTRFRDLAIPPDRPVLPFDMVYGVPAVIGAKKGFPNFNRFSVNRDIQVRRDLYVLKDGSGRAFQTNQAYSLMISNILGVEGWNSYNAGYTGSVQVLAVGNLGYGLMNNSNQYVFNTLKNQYVNTLFTPPQGNTVVPNWPGSGTLVSGGVPRAPQRASFSIPISVISSNNIYLTNTAYRTAQGDLVSMDPGLLDNHDEFRVPTLRLNITNRLRFALVDVAANRILDYVNLNEVEPTLDITDLCTRNRTGVQECTFPIGAPISDQQKVGSLVYCTNRVHNPQNPVDLTFGVQNQMFISRSGHNYTSDAIWRSCTPLSTTQVDSESSQFNLWVQSTDIRFANQRMRAPFTAVRTIHHYVSWQANDPLVHYTVRDLKEQLSSPSTNMVKNARIEMDDSSDNSPMKYFADPSQLTVNKAYRPWGANGPDGGETVIPTTTNILVKDPLVGRSDDWDLTTNKFPNIGWLGRIHRGTPWQTVYFKSSVVDKLGTWGGRDAGPAWVAHNITNWDGFGSILFDAIRTDPTNDYRAADLFTTAFNDNSSRGKLSINQTNLAAWSAVLSGVSVPTNIMAASNSAYTTFIEPAGIYNPSSKPPVVQILEGINTVRTNFPGGTFSRLGDILYVPQLSLSSPYLTNGNAAFMSDEVYERIPQQILGLLRGGEQPRYVVYAFGQALKPAERSIMNNGPYFGLCTNYQVTAETTVRAVVRIDGSADPAQANNPDPARRYPLRAVVESYNVLGPYY